MMRLHTLYGRLNRLLHRGIVCQDHVLGQLQACTADHQVFDVVGKNKTRLDVNHVGCAIGLLWQFQKERPEMLRTVEATRNHPQFLTLRVLAENKIGLMDDVMLVDVLYGVLRLKIEPYDSLVQQLVIEGWNRLERFPLATLSKFAVCLNDQGLYNSPLMGQITEIVSQRLDSITDARVLTTLMISISSLPSARLRDALIEKADIILDSTNAVHTNNSRRIVQFLRNIKYFHRPLLEKCIHVFLQNVPHMDVENLGIILTMNQTVQYSSWEFIHAAQKRLIDLLDSSTDASSFTKLYLALGPLAGRELRDRLECTTLMLADELNPQQALVIAETLVETQCRNPQLINKIASVLHKNVEVYKPVEIAKIIQALSLLHCQSPELFSRLRFVVLRYLQVSVQPYEVIMLIRVLSMLPSPRIEELVFSRIDAVLPQCSLIDLNTVTMAIAKWIRNDSTYGHSTHSKYVRLLQSVNQCARKRVNRAERLELIMEELKYLSGEWFEEMLLEETIIVLQRLADQLSWINVTEMALLLTKTNCRCTPLLEKVASVALENMDKMHFSAIYPTLLPFAVLNYNSPKVDELFEAYIQHFTPKISSFDPHLLVQLAYSLAMADHFPEAIIKEIFSVNFLAKLDTQLEALPDTLNMRVRLRLMQLNRAVCLECPEFQVPWFHERYCMLMEKDHSASPVQQQIHRMLSEVLGGHNCARVAVQTPYFYTVDFECILDHNQQAVPYSKPIQLQIREDGKVQWESGSAENDSKDLPPGARRIAIDFLNSKSFCKNSQHIKGNVQMRKRHLEILGYHVLQIPHFEWNSMELSTPDSWKEYLRKKIFTKPV